MRWAGVQEVASAALRICGEATGRSLRGEAARRFSVQGILLYSRKE